MLIYFYLGSLPWQQLKYDNSTIKLLKQNIIENNILYLLYKKIVILKRFKNTNLEIIVNFNNFQHSEKHIKQKKKRDFFFTEMKSP